LAVEQPLSLEQAGKAGGGEADGVQENQVVVGGNDDAVGGGVIGGRTVTGGRALAGALDKAEVLDTQGGDLIMQAGGVDGIQVGRLAGAEAKGVEAVLEGVMIAVRGADFTGAGDFLGGRGVGMEVGRQE